MSNYSSACKSLVKVVLGILAVTGTLSAAVSITNSATQTLPTGSTQFALSASGATGPMVWSLASGTLPPGLAIRTDVPGYFNPSTQTAGLIGVATTPGTYNFSVSVTDGSTTDTKALTVKITGLNIRDPYNLPNASVGNAYSYQFSAINASAPTFAAVGALPTGLTLSSSGLLSGTPTADGAPTFQITVTDGADSVTSNFSVTVTAVRITTPSLLLAGTQASTYNVTLTSTGGSVTWSAPQGLPSGLSLSSTGILSSSNITAGVGLHSVYVMATPTSGMADSKYLLLPVNGTSPALLSASTTFIPDDATVGDRYSTQWSPCCGGSGPVTWTATGLPTGLSLRFGEGVTSPNVPAGAVEIWGIPQATGLFNVNLTATGGDGQSATLVLPIRVSALGYSPLNTTFGTIGTAYTQNLRVIGGTAPYSVALAPGESLPLGLALSGPPPVLSGTPLENGGGTPQLVFSDGTSTLNRRIFVNIGNTVGNTMQINNNSDMGAISLGNPFSNTFFASGGTAPLTWAVTSGALPPGLTLSTGGSLTGTPTAGGTYNFLVRVTDSAAKTAFRQFKLVVAAISITSNSTLPFGNVSSAYSTTLAATGGSGARTWSLMPGSQLPPGLSLNPSTGVISGTPGATGQYFFFVQVSDTAANYGRQQCFVNIYPAGGTPPVTISTGSSLGNWRIGTTQIELVAAGGNGTYTWSLTSGTLPPGLAIRPDKPNFFSNAAQAGLIGVATTPGTYNFTLTATSGSSSASRAFSVNIVKLRVMQPSIPDIYVGQPFSFTFTPLEAAGTVSYTLDPTTPLPAGITMTSGGTISGTPTASGNTFYRYTMTDGVETSPGQFGLSITALRFTSNLTLPNATQGVAYPGYSFAAAGGTGAITYASSGGIPAGLTLAANGALSGTVTGGPGMYNFSVTATDSTTPTANSYTRQFSLSVIGAPITLPRITFGNYDDVTLGNTFTLQVGTCCGGTGPFTWNVTGLPAGAGFRFGSTASSYVQPQSVEIYGSVRVPGSYPVVVTATDATGLATSGSFPLVVGTMDVSSAAFSSSSLPNGTINQAYSSTLRILGGVQPHTVSQPQFGTKLPAGLTLNGTTRTVSGTPTENAFYSPILTYTDAAGTTFRRTSSIQITGGTNTISVNGSGIGNYDLGYALLGSAYSTTFGACCIPNAYTWTLVSGPLPPGLNLSSAGVLSGTPNSTGVYFFLVRATDSTNAGNSGVHEFKLTVTPLSITTSSLPYGNVATAYNQTLAITGATGAVTWALLPGNSNGLPPGLTLSAGGVISGTPTSAGSYNFTVVATDSATVPFVTTRSYSLNIYPVGGTPPLTLSFNTNFNLAIGRVLQGMSATGGTPPYHFSYSPSATPIPGLRVQDGPPLPITFSAGTSGTLIGVATTPGQYTTSIRVTDSAASPAVFDRTTTMTIMPMIILNQTTIPKATLNQSYSYTLSPAGGAGAFTFANATGFPSGTMSLSSSGVITGTPTASGTFNINFTLANAAVSCITGNCTASYSVTLTVDPFAITNGPVLPQATVGTSYTAGSPLATFAASNSNCGSSCTWSVSGGSLPTGLTLDGSGRLVGNMSGGTQTSFTIQASGSAGTVQKVFGLSVVPTVKSGLSISTNITTSLVTGGSTATQLSATGGTPPYTFQLTSGSLPPGINLSDASNTGEKLAGALNPGFYYLYGRGTTPGTYNFTLQVTDAATKTATKAFTLVISEMSLEYTSLPLNSSSSNCGTTPCLPFVIDQALPTGGQPLLVIGGSGSYPSWSPAGPFPGLTINPATGVITGTPSFSGSLTQLLTVTDSAGKQLLTNLAISPTSGGSTVTLSGGPALGTVTLGSTFSFGVTPSGGTAPYTISQVGPVSPATGASLLLLPPNGTTTAFQQNANGIQIFATSPGTYTFTLQATDSTGLIGRRTYTVQALNTSSISSTSLPDAPVGVAYSQRLYAFGPAVTFSVAPGSELPPGMTLSSAGVLGGTPTAVGTYSFVTNFGDAGGVGTATLSMRVTGINITSPSVLPQGIAGTDYNGAGYQLTATGGAGPITWTASNLPSFLSLNSQGLLTGEVPSSSSRFNFTVTASDGVTNTSKTIAIFVKQPNASQLDLPISVTRMTDAVVGQVYTWTVVPSGGVAPYSIAVASGSSLPPGLFILNPLPPGTTPGSLVLGGAVTTAGSYTFDLIISDSASASITRTFTLKIGVLSFTGGAPRSAIVGSPYSFQFTPAGGTPPYTFSVAQPNALLEVLPPGLTMNASGLVSGTPTSTGNFSSNFTVADSAGASFTRSVAFSVTNSLGTSVGNSNLATTAGSSVQVSLNASGISGSPVWSIPTGTLPPGTTLQNGAIVGNFAAPGVFNFTVRATDPANGSNFADRALRYEIAPMQQVAPAFNTGSTIVLPKATVGSPYSLSLKVAGGTPPYTFAPGLASPLPPGLSLSSAGVLSGTPTQAGLFPIRSVVTDSAGARLFNNGGTLLVTAVGGRQNLFDLGENGPGSASVGSFFSFALDGLVAGVPPYTWSVSSGSLPPGLSILPGTNGVPTYLAGIPTTAGEFPFNLQVTDAGQTLTIAGGLLVSPLTLTPTTIPNGIVGTPYSVSLVASGGTAPYTLSLAQGSPVIPGLTLAGASLSGTPTVPGIYPIRLILKDSAGTPNQLERAYFVTIDNAAGQAPAISVSPKPINILYIQGDPAPSVGLSVASTSGALPFTGAVLGLSAGSLSATSGATPATPNLNINVTGLGVGRYSGLVGINSTGSIYSNDATPVSLTVLAPPPCTYSLTPSSASYSGVASSGTFNISTGPTCAWTAALGGSTPWLTLTGATTGTGSGTVAYSVTANTNPAQRSGTITAGGQTFTVTQFGTSCSFAIRPVSLDAPAEGGSATIDVVASGSTCSWPASSGLSVVTPSPATGSGQATITIPVNTNAGSQTLTATIAGQTLTVNQAGAACTPILGTPGTTMPSGGGSGSVAISAAPGCGYSTIVGPAWISITSGGSGTLPGSGTANVTFAVSSNSTTSTRSGNLLVGGQAFLITQDGLACSVTLDTSTLPSPYSVAGGNGTVGISANGPNCAWTALSNSAFASVSPPSGTGNGTVTVSLTSNSSSATARTGSVTISGQNVGITQAGTVCTYALRALTSSVPYTGGVGSVGVIAPSACSWTASSNAAFLTVISGASANGTQEVQFVVSPNNNAAPQTGTLTIAGQNFTVTQGAAPCTFTLALNGITVASTGVASSTLNYSTVQNGCSVTPISYAGWLTISNTFAGNSGTLTYSASANPAATNRTGNIQIGDKVFTVTQSGAACAYSLNSYGAAYNKLGGAGTILGSPNALGCTPVTGTSQPSIIQLAPLGGPNLNIFNQDYIVNPFNSVVKAVRRALITFGGQVFAIKQSSY